MYRYEFWRRTCWSLHSRLYFPPPFLCRQDAGGGSPYTPIASGISRLFTKIDSGKTRKAGGLVHTGLLFSPSRSHDTIRDTSISVHLLSRYSSLVLDYYRRWTINSTTRLRAFSNWHADSQTPFDNTIVRCRKARVPKLCMGAEGRPSHQPK